MENRPSTGLSIGIGCGIVLLLVTVGLVLYFVVGRSAATSIATGTSITPRGYRVTPGAVGKNTEGQTTATLHVTIEDGWKVIEFDASAERVWTSEIQLPATLSSGLPSLPATQSFDLVFTVPEEHPNAPADTPDFLSVEVFVHATEGLVFTNHSSSHGTRAYRIDAEAGRLVEMK